MNAVPLGEVATVKSGFAFKSKDWRETGVPVIKIANVKDGSIALEGCSFVSEETASAARNCELSSGDILISMTGYIGEVAKVRNEGRMLLNQRVGKFSIKAPSRLDSEYLFQWLRLSEVRASLEARAHGAAQPNISPTAIEQQLIALPSLPVQRRIASILSAYDDLIENNTRRIAILEEMARRIYEEWFVHFRFPGHEKVRMVATKVGSMPEGWSVQTLGDLVEDVRETISPGAVPPETPYVGLEHIPRRSIALADWGTAAEVQSTKVRFREGDILFGKIRPYFHKVAVAPVAGVASSDAIVIRPKAERDFALALAVISSDAFIAEATQTSNGTKMPRANWEVLKRYAVPVPPDTLRICFDELMAGIVSAVSNHALRNRNLCTTRDLLLPKLISGELGVAALPDQDAVAA